MSSPELRGLEASVRKDRQSASALESIATLTWAVPLAFCLLYLAAWFFHVKNLLLISGHLFALGSASLMAEAGSRLSDRPGLKGPAILTQVLSLSVVVCLLYALYPMIRMFIASDEAFLVLIEAEDPALRLALTTAFAYALGAAAVASFAQLLARCANEFDQKISGLKLVILATFLAAGLAAALHAAFAARTELRELRHLLAFGLFGVSVLVYTRLYPAIQRVAQCLHRQASLHTNQQA